MLAMCNLLRILTYWWGSTRAARETTQFLYIQRVVRYNGFSYQSAPDDFLLNVDDSGFLRFLRI
jgi:hypothetical protein